MRWAGGRGGERLKFVEADGDERDAGLLFTSSLSQKNLKRIKSKQGKKRPQWKGQQNPHLTDINRQRSPESKVCLLAGSTSLLTSSALRACWQQIYKTLEERSKIVIVVYVICISLVEISGEPTRNYFKNRIIQAKILPSSNTSSSSY